MFLGTMVKEKVGGMGDKIKKSMLRRMSSVFIDLKEKQGDKIDDNLFKDMREDEVKEVRKALHKDRKWLGEIRDAHQYVKTVMREATNHLEKCEKDKGVCEVCRNFDKRIPEPYKIEKKLG